MTNQEFIQYIQTQDSYKQAIGQYSPLLITLGGSRCVGFETEKSDYDLGFIVADDWVHFKSIQLPNDKNLHVHIMIYSFNIIKRFFNQDEGVGRHVMYGLSLLNNSIVIYKNPDFDICYNWLIEHKARLNDMILYELIGNSYILIQNIIATNEYIYFNPKLYYHLIRVYDILKHTDHNQLIKNLRIKERKPTNEEFKTIQLISQDLKNFYDCYDITKNDDLAVEFEVLTCQLQ